MSKLHDPDPPIEQYQTTNWSELESCILRESCPCCDRKFTQDNRMSLMARCHPHSDVIPAYWDGFIYLTCATCSKPVVRIPVDRSLL